MKLIFLGLLFSLNTFAGFDHEHSKWNDVLTKYTTQIRAQVFFNYLGLKKNQNSLAAYLGEIESLRKEEFNQFTKEQKLAFWINVYNAYTVQLILINYPVKSIKEIESGLFSKGPWKKEFISIFGKKLGLDDIEHEIIRKKFNEPRIHFAVNCASIGCPSLMQEAFVAVKLDDQLNRAAMIFLTNKSKNDVKGNTLYLSKIFQWYGDDFIGKHGSFQKYVIKTLQLPMKNYHVEFKDYDWNLNEAK